VELWDFGFYVLFGVVITISVRYAGVLLVFSYLIVPAVITRLYSDRVLPRLLAGWGVAVVASALGLWASWVWDLPTGAAMVAAFGAVLVVAGVARVSAAT
jgi:zinc/manganese transport system permease protein